MLILMTVRQTLEFRKVLRCQRSSTQSVLIGLKRLGSSKKSWFPASYVCWRVFDDDFVEVISCITFLSSDSLCFEVIQLAVILEMIWRFDIWLHYFCYPSRKVKTRWSVETLNNVSITLTVSERYPSQHHLWSTQRFCTFWYSGLWF